MPPGFDFENSGLVTFSCEAGHGVIEPDFGRRQCVIYEFSSKTHERGGGGRRTLQWLSDFFDRVNVLDPGEEGEDAWLFWSKMLEEGLVAAIYDEDQNLLASRKGFAP
jgi:hypothetical protein